MQSENRTKNRNHVQRALFALLLLGVIGLGAAYAQADTEIIRSVGGQNPPFGGEIGAAAVDQPSGDLYVADEANGRVHRIASSGEFERLWGLDVVVPGGTGDTGQQRFEICTVAQECQPAPHPNVWELSYLPERELRYPQAIAVDPGGSSVYVGDDRWRVQKFSSDGVFLRSWGRGVGARNETQRVTKPPFAPTFTLTFKGETTAPIPDQASGQEVAKALEDLPSIKHGEVEGAGMHGISVVEFVNGLGGTDQPQMTGSGSTGVTTLVDGAGSATPDLCTVEADCERATEGAAGGQFADVSAIAVAPAGSPSAGNVLVGDMRRIQEFDPSGSFVRAVGWDVVRPGGAGNIANNEVQSVSVDATGGTFRLLTDWQDYKNQYLGVFVEATGGTFIISLRGQSTAPIAYDAAPGVVESELEALPDVESDGVASVSSPAPGTWNVVLTESGGWRQGAGAAEVNGAGLTGPAPHAHIDRRAVTGPIAANATAAEVDGALEVLPSTGVGTANVSGPAGGPWSVEFTGALADRDVPQLLTSVVGLTGGAQAATVTTPTTGGAFEVCTVAAECKMGTGGDEVGQFSWVGSLAVDSTGAIYAADVVNPDRGPGLRVQKLAPDAGPLGIVPAEFAPGLLNATTEANGPRYVAVGGDDNVFVAKAGMVRELTSSGVEAPDSPHLASASLGDGTGDSSAGIKGLVVNRASGTVYVLGGGRIYELGSLEAPTVALEASNLGPTGVTLNGLVNPRGPGGTDGVRTSYRVEYRAQGETEWATAGDVADAGNGFTDVPVSRQLTGLSPNTAYEARLVAIKAGTPGAVTPVVSFTTPLSVDPPTVTVVAPQDRTETSATLNAWIDPNFSPTKYRFEYGPTASYGAVSPEVDIGSGGSFVQVTLPLTGLEPGTEYHFRVVAENGNGVTESEDRVFVTRSAEAPPVRGYEMITPPFKMMRGAVDGGGPDGYNANPGLASLDGEKVLWNLDVFPLTDEVASPFSGDRRVISRTPIGWQNRTLLTQPMVPGAGTRMTSAMWTATSGDFSAFAWEIGNAGDQQGALLPTPGDKPLRFYTRRDGTGTNGFTGWLSNTDTQVADHGLEQLTDMTIFNDEGSWMARWGHYRGVAEQPLTPGDDDPSDQQQLFGPSGGSTAYLQGDPPNGAIDLIGECTGLSGGGTDPAEVPTQLPTRSGSGLPTDTLTTRACAEGTLTSPRGAAVGGNSGTGVGAGPSITAMSQDGRRIFFASPDPEAAEVPASCATATDSGTDCPPQLFVRQYDSEGNPIVRWISRPRGVGVQQIAQLAPAGFQGASRDGRHVYFYTSSPLLPSDPNGSVSITDGSATTPDLYRYTLPESLDADPDAGTLERVSGGPDGDADPSASGGEQGPLRFLSDDGKRAYFVTTGPIAGADAIPPAGGGTAPGSNPGGGAATRNLYLFDDTGQSPKWTFIARIPHSSAGSAAPPNPANLDRCASDSAVVGATMGYQGFASGIGITAGRKDATCFRGTPGGEAVIFSTRGQLTADDDDNVDDIFLYDARTDELERITRPSFAGANTYNCRGGLGYADAQCRGDLGFEGVGMTAGFERSRGWGGSRHMNVAIDDQGVVSAYFESRSRLVAEDTNGDYYDVYEWRDGNLSLMSPGDTDDHSYYSGNSVDGEDVFIETSSRIDPRELDDHDYDIYDFRIGGGFPYTPPPEPCDVLSLECEGQASAPPASRGPSTTGPVTPSVVPGSGCQGLAERARRLWTAARRARRAGQSSRARGGSDGGAKKLSRRAAKLERKARNVGKRSRACTRRDGRGGR